MLIVSVRHIHVTWDNANEMKGYSVESRKCCGLEKLFRSSYSDACRQKQSQPAQSQETARDSETNLITLQSVRQ